MLGQARVGQAGLLGHVRPDVVRLHCAWSGMSANVRFSGCQVRLRVIHVKLGQARLDQARSIEARLV